MNSIFLIFFLIILIIFLTLVYAADLYCPSGATSGCVDCTGTASSPCHVCDTTDMYVKIYNPSGSLAGTEYLDYDSESGTCGSTPEVTETWKKNIGYKYCSEEGTYTTVVYAQINSGDYEYSESFDLYTVNWDTNSNWCTCKTGSSSNWFSSYTDGNNPNCCGDDGSNDMFENAGTGNSACIKGSVIQHNTATSDKRYMTYNGEIFFCKEAGGSGSGYSFVQDVNPGSEVGICKCDQAGNWNCGGVVLIRGGRVRIV